MKNAIILHGFPSKKAFIGENFVAPGNAHWLPWLQKELLQRNIYAETHIMPSAYEPDYETWKKAVERCDHIGPDTIIVGHSCGGGFWIKYLSEHPDLKVGKVVLVAPWLDPEDELKNDFHKNYDLDKSLVDRTGGVTIFVSDNDEESIAQSVKRLKEGINGMKVIELKGRGHFTYGAMKTIEFPELLEEILA